MEINKTEIDIFHAWLIIFENGFVGKLDVIAFNKTGDMYRKYIDAGYIIKKNNDVGEVCLFFTEAGKQYIKMMKSFYDL